MLAAIDESDARRGERRLEAEGRYARVRDRIATMDVDSIVGSSRPASAAGSAGAGAAAGYITSAAGSGSYYRGGSPAAAAAGSSPRSRASPASRALGTPASTPLTGRR